MVDFARIHDGCLDFENEIIESAEELTELRIKIYKSGKPENIQFIMPVLNCIMQEVQECKDYIMRKLKEVSP